MENSWNISLEIIRVSKFFETLDYKPLFNNLFLTSFLERHHQIKENQDVKTNERNVGTYGFNSKNYSENSSNS